MTYHLAGSILRPPIEVRNELVIKAPAERLWDLLADVERWPSWYRACRWVRLEPGRDKTQPLSFRWKAHPVELLSTVTATDRPHRFAYNADATGLRAKRTFTLHPGPTGACTLVVSHEIQIGPLPWLARMIIAPSLRAANQAMLADLARATTLQNSEVEP